MDSGALEFRMLGELEVRRDGVSLPQPPSKKTRALLAYLVLTGRSHRRDALCSLLWDVADDPRGALRWSLSKLRRQVDDDANRRLRADREHVEFRAGDARVDVLEMRRELDGGRHESASTEVLETWCRRCTGELLEGLDLPDFDAFQAWLTAEREDARRLHAAAIRTLVQRHRPKPDLALPFARIWAQVDPLSAEARLAVMRLALAAGRTEEATRQLDAARRTFAEIDPARERQLFAEWQAMRAGSRTLEAEALPREIEAERRPAPQAPVPASARILPLVGREAETAILAETMRDVGTTRRARLALLTGEPGIGKSRLVREVIRRCRADGSAVLEGAAFEGEAGRPYGPWIDALRRLGAPELAEETRDELAALLAGTADPRTQSREALFAGVAALLRALGEGRPMLVVVLDDVHWLDDGSAELLHYAARTLRDRPVLFLLTAREAELHDQRGVVRALRSLRRDVELRELSVPRLDRDAIVELVHHVDRTASAERLFAHSGGNPLFALELARAGGAPERAGNVAEAVRDRVSRLPPEAGDVLRWAAVLGTVADQKQLAALSTLDAESQLASLETLERHALLHRESESGYVFSHEIVRRVVYSDLSQPRRVLMHRRAAEMLRRLESDQAGGVDEDAIADIARHAALGEDHALAAEACVAAGRRCLRLFASANAFTLARRGLRHARELPDGPRARFTLDLLEVQLWARRPAEPEAFCQEVEALTELALENGAIEHARLGFLMVSYVRWERGEWNAAREQIMRSELSLPKVEGPARVDALGEAARCLALLERDLGQAQAMAAEAQLLSRQLGVPSAPLVDALGLLKLHLGDTESAEAFFAQAQSIARANTQRYGEIQALVNRFQLIFDSGRYAEALVLAEDLKQLADKTREGSEGPFADVLVVLAKIALGHQSLEADLSRSLEGLRMADAKHRLAYGLTRAASQLNQRGDPATALRLAEEGLAIARFLERPSDVVLALCELATARRALGDRGGVEEAVAAMKETAKAPLSAHARRTIQTLKEA